MQKEKTIIHNDESELLFSPKILKNNIQETHRFNLVITDDELKAVPEVLKLYYDHARVYCTFKLTGDYVICHMEVKAKINIIDNHDFKEKSLIVFDFDDLTLSTDEEVSDIMPDRNGCYDLRPVALALFYSAVPGDYSTGKLNTYRNEWVEVITEEEYNSRISNKKNNPFYKLKEDTDKEK